MKRAREQVQTAISEIRAVGRGGILGRAEGTAEGDEFFCLFVHLFYFCDRRELNTLVKSYKI